MWRAPIVASYVEGLELSWKSISETVTKHVAASQPVWHRPSPPSFSVHLPVRNMPKFKSTLPLVGFFSPGWRRVRNMQAVF